MPTTSVQAQRRWRLLLLLVLIARGVQAVNVTILATGPLTVGGTAYFSGGTHTCIAMSLAVDALNRDSNNSDADLTYQLRFFDNAELQSVGVYAAATELLLTHLGTGQHRPVDHNIIGLVSDYFSAIAEAVQFLAAGYNTPQIGYGSTAPALSDNTKYPYFVRTVTSDSDRGPVFVALLQQFQWQEVAILSLNDAFGQGLRQSLLNELDQLPASRAKPQAIADIVLPFASVNNPQTTLDALATIRSKELRVILLFGSSITAVMQLAASVNMTTPDFQWLIADLQNSTYPGLMIVRHSGQGSALAAQVDFFGQFFAAYKTNHYPQCNPANFSLPELTSNSSVDIFALPAYDAILSYAHAAQQLLAADVGQLANVSDSEILALLTNGTRLLDVLKLVNFEGLSGPVAFSSDGNLITGKYSIVINVAGEDQAYPIGLVTVASGSVTALDMLETSAIPWYNRTGPVPAPKLCNAGFYLQVDTSECLPCYQGSFAPTRGSTCWPCMDGSVSRLPAASSCEICRIGTYANAGKTDCMICDQTSYAPSVGMTACLQCPGNSSTGILGATDISQCTCLPGFFPSPQAVKTLTCEPCAVGGYCNGKTLPIAMDGYFQSALNVFLLCNPSTSCANNSCVAPLTGVACANCLDDLIYNPDTNSCISCSRSGSIVIVLIIAFFAVFIAYWISRLKLSSFFGPMDETLFVGAQAVSTTTTTILSPLTNNTVETTEAPTPAAIDTDSSAANSCVMTSTLDRLADQSARPPIPKEPPPLAASKELDEPFPWSFSRALLTNLMLLVTFIQIQSIIGTFALKQSATSNTFAVLEFALGDLQRIYACLFLAAGSGAKPYWSVFQWKLSFPLIVPGFLLLFWALDGLHYLYVHYCPGMTAYFAKNLPAIDDDHDTNQHSVVATANQKEQTLQPGRSAANMMVTVTAPRMLKSFFALVARALRMRVRHLLTNYERMSLSAAINTLLLLGDFLYLYEVNIALSIFHCYEQPNGTFSLLQQPNVFCYQGDWLINEQSAYAAATLYGLGVPLAYTIILFIYGRDLKKRKESIKQADNERRESLAASGAILEPSEHWIDYDVAFSSLIEKFNLDSYWWHLVLQVKKIFISIIVGFIVDTGIRTVVCFVGIALFLAMTMYRRPFLFRTGQWLEVMSLVLHMCVLALGLLQHYGTTVVGVQAFASSDRDNAINITSVTLLAIGIATFIGVATYDLWRFIRSTSPEWRKKLRSDYQRRVRQFANAFGIMKFDKIFFIIDSLWEDRQLMALSVLERLAGEEQVVEGSTTFITLEPLAKSPSSTPP